MIEGAMKTIGLIGGMSWESTATYYKQINEGIKQALGGLNSAKICMISLNFAEIEACQHRGDWETASQILIEAARSLEAAGADFVLICTNTMHKVATQVEASVSIPLLHIARATGDKLKKDKIAKLALLGTRFTMEETFYKQVLQAEYGLDVIVPTGDDAKTIHDVIYNELCLGICSQKSKEAYLNIIEKLRGEGAEAVILGCTEIGLLISQESLNLPIYDTSLIHAEKAVEQAIQN